jgi:CheY-like chemotaxis protein
VRSDPVLLHGVLSNLVSNAIKYTRAGRVDVELFMQDNEITISVRDTGMGIPPEKIDHIFKEFVRLDRADSSTEEGLGLGLSIVKRYAQLLDLKLSVSSQLNQGSCFSIRLQAIEAVAVHAQVRALSHAMSLNDTRLQGLRVLVVDNVELVLSSMLRTLAGWGCEVYGARSLAEASAVIEGITLNMVISDFHLGDKQPDGHSLPALLMTGDVSGHLEAQARRCQVDVLHKPVRPDVLLHRVLSQLQLAPVSVAEAPVLL